MRNVLVSVIIPACDCANSISRALDSALCQDVPLEIIVINDASRDNLDQVMEAYRDYPQIRYLRNSKNLGVSETRNRGVRCACGEYIAFLDADDQWEVGKLKKQLEVLQEKKGILSSTARELMNSEGVLTGYVIPVKTEITFKDLCRQNQINCSSVMIKREVALEFPMCCDDCHEDYLIWLKILKKYGTCYAINEPLLKYRVSATGKSGSKWHSAKMTFRTYRYMGFGLIRSAYYFAHYTFHGIRKYLPWFLKD